MVNLKTFGVNDCRTQVVVFCSYIDAVRELGDGQFIQDFHLYDVIVFPKGTDFHDNSMLTAGEIILQDKVSITGLSIFQSFHHIIS